MNSYGGRAMGRWALTRFVSNLDVKKGSFYHFFRSKSELTVAAYEYYWEQISLGFGPDFLEASAADGKAGSLLGKHSPKSD